MPGEAPEPFEVRDALLIRRVVGHILGNPLMDDFDELKEHDQPRAVLEAARGQWQKTLIGRPDPNQLDRFRLISEEVIKIERERNPLGYNPIFDREHPSYRQDGDIVI